MSQNAWMRSGRAAVNTATGQQTFTVSGVTDIPIAARLVITNATADETQVTHACLGIGLVANNAQRYASVASESGLTISDTWSCGGKQAIGLVDQTGAVVFAASFVGFVAGGIVLNITTASSAFLLTYELLGGTLVDWALAEIDTINFTTPVTLFDTAAENSNLVGLVIQSQAFDSIPLPFATIAHGFFAGSTITQAAWSWRDNDAVDSGATPLECSNYVSDTDIINDHSNTALDGSVAIASVTSQAVAIDFSADSGYGWPGAMLVGRMRGPEGFQAKALQFSQPASTGVKTVTGVGFESRFGFLATAIAGTVNAMVTNQNAEGIGTGSWNKHGEQFASQIHSKDGAGPTSCRSRVNDVLLDVERAAGSRSTGVYVTTMPDGLGYNLTASATIRRHCALFVGVPPSVRIKGKASLLGKIALAPT